MDINRRKFFSKSLLFGSVGALSVYTLSSTNASPKVSIKPHKIHATYTNSKHNRQFYRSARF